jgi:hypothetical protein
MVPFLRKRQSHPANKQDGCAPKYRAIFLHARVHHHDLPQSDWPQTMILPHGANFR